MKWNNEIRQQFTIYVLCSNVDQGASIKASLSQDGYNSFLLTDVDGLTERMRADPSHVLVFTPGSIDLPLEEFVKGMLYLNSELRIVSVVEASELLAVRAFRLHNFAPPVLAGEGALTMLLWTVDEVCQALYIVYQSEQLLEAQAKLQAQVTQLEADMKKSQVQTEHSSGIEVAGEVLKFRQANSKEEVLNIFFREMNQKFMARNQKISAIFFKYLPTVQSFVAMQALGMDLESLKGVGGRLSQQEARDPETFFAGGGVPDGIRSLLSEGLNAQEAIVKLVFVRDSLDGIFAIWGTSKPLFAQEFENEFALFQVLYERGHLLRQLTTMDFADAVTELYGRQFYTRRLAEEVTRARRLQKAVSVLKLSVDHMDEIAQVLGRGGVDQVLRLIASVVQKSSRVNDLVCRTADNEFSVVLPHTARKGASLRAERLRRMLESQLSRLTTTAITVSCGVAEYPSHCSNPEDLDKVCLAALEFISGRGGNKVCLFQPAEDFKPDYEVPPI